MHLASELGDRTTDNQINAFQRSVRITEHIG